MQYYRVLTIESGDLRKVTDHLHGVPFEDGLSKMIPRAKARSIAANTGFPYGPAEEMKARHDELTSEAGAAPSREELEGRDVPVGYADQDHLPGYNEQLKELNEVGWNPYEVYGKQPNSDEALKLYCAYELGLDALPASTPEEGVDEEEPQTKPVDDDESPVGTDMSSETTEAEEEESTDSGEQGTTEDEEPEGEGSSDDEPDADVVPKELTNGEAEGGDAESA